MSQPATSNSEQRTANRVSRSTSRGPTLRHGSQPPTNLCVHSSAMQPVHARASKQGATRGNESIAHPVPQVAAQRRRRRGTAHGQGDRGHQHQAWPPAPRRPDGVAPRVSFLIILSPMTHRSQTSQPVEHCLRLPAHLAHPPRYCRPGMTVEPSSLHVWHLSCIRERNTCTYARVPRPGCPLPLCSPSALASPAPNRLCPGRNLIPDPNLNSFPSFSSHPPSSWRTRPAPEQ